MHYNVHRALSKAFAVTNKKALDKLAHGASTLPIFLTLPRPTSPHYTTDIALLESLPSDLFKQERPVQAIFDHLKARLCFSLATRAIRLQATITTVLDKQHAPHPS